MIYVCPEKDAAVKRPCSPCTCGMDNLSAFRDVSPREPAPEAKRPDQMTGEELDLAEEDALRIARAASVTITASMNLVQDIRREMFVRKMREPRTRRTRKGKPCG